MQDGGLGEGEERNYGPMNSHLSNFWYNFRLSFSLFLQRPTFDSAPNTEAPDSLPGFMLCSHTETQACE